MAVTQKSLDDRGGVLSAFEGSGTGARGHRNEMVAPGPSRGKTHSAGSEWRSSSHRSIDHGRKARPSRSIYCKAALGTPHYPGLFMLRGKVTTLRRSRGGPEGAKAQSRKLPMPWLYLARRSRFFQVCTLETHFAGRSKVQTHCLRSGGLAPQSPFTVNIPR